jgi:hypothetical protein
MGLLFTYMRYLHGVFRLYESAASSMDSLFVHYEVWVEWAANKADI